MKKFYLTALVLAAIAPATSARLNTINAQAPHSAAAMRDAKPVGLLTGQPMATFDASPIRVMKAPETPAGEVKHYVREAYTYYNMMGLTAMSYTPDFASDIIFDGTTVWLQDPISEAPTGAYIQGTLDGDQVTFEFPQSLGKFYGEDAVINLMKLEWTDIENEKVMYFQAPAEDNKITLTLGADGKLTMPEAANFAEGIDMPDTILGLCDTDNNWSGFGEWDAIYTINTNVAVNRPEGVEFKEYQVRYNEMVGQYVMIGIDGNSIYLSGLSEHFPDACVVGTLEGGKAIFKSRQFLGIDQEYRKNCYFISYELEWGYDEYYGQEGWLFTLTDELVMDYDAATSTLTTADGFALNLSNEELYYTILFNNPTFSPRAAEFIASAPENPCFDLVEDYNPDPNYCYARMIFSLPMFNVHNQLMDLEKVFYNVYFGSELYVFDPSIFINLTQPMTDIPYLFCDTPEYGGYEIKAPGVEHYIYFDNVPDIDMSIVGVQLIYKDDDGTLYKSDLVYYDPASLTAVDAEVETAAVVYTNLLGAEVKNPSAGIYIKTLIGKDGSRKSQKVVLN